MDYYQILGVTRDADAKAVHSAFRELSKKMHPDRFRESDRAKAEQRYQLIVKAFNTLKDPKARRQYDQSIATPNEPSQEQQYSSYYKAGMIRYQKKDYESAAQCFEKAVFLKPTAEAFFYKGMSEAKVPRRTKSAIESLQKATEMDPFNSKYLQAQVTILADLGMTVRATAALNRALEVLPDDPRLLELKRQLTPEPETRGLFGNLLKKIKGE